MKNRSDYTLDEWIKLTPAKRKKISIEEEKEWLKNSPPDLLGDSKGKSVAVFNAIKSQIKKIDTQCMLWALQMETWLWNDEIAAKAKIPAKRFEDIYRKNKKITESEAKKLAKIGNSKWWTADRIMNPYKCLKTENFAILKKKLSTTKMTVKEKKECLKNSLNHDKTFSGITYTKKELNSLKAEIK